jgi:hypothetical protein
MYVDAPKFFEYYSYSITYAQTRIKEYVYVNYYLLLYNKIYIMIPFFSLQVKAISILNPIKGENNIDGQIR